MTNVFRFFTIVLVAAALLVSCAGEDGDPGPKGDAGEQGEQGDKGDQGDAGTDAAAKRGYLQGTIKGNRKDGTAFEDAFKYEYVFGDEMFNGNGIVLQRFETASGAIADAIVTAAQQSGSQMEMPLDKGYMKLFGLKTDDGIDFDNFWVYHTKGISASQVFQMKARPHLQDAYYDRVIELSPENNGIYNFEHNAKGQLAYWDYDLDHDDKPDAYAFTIFTNSGYNTFVYAWETGELAFVEIDGEVTQEGSLFDKYNDIKFVYNKGFDLYVFVSAANDAPLYEYVEEVPADEFTITNYTVQDGVVSFDFNLKISKYRGYMGSQSPMGPVLIHGENTTYHDLTITGKFNSGGKVYTETVARVRG